MSKLTTLDQLKLLAQRTKVEIDAVDTKVTTLSNRVNDLVTAGGEPNVLTGIKVNGSLLTLADKIADILIAEGATNGTISVNNVDVAVHGLAALAYKAEVSESDLSTALKAIIDAKAKQSDLDTLTGTGEGSITKMIDDAFNDFSTKVTDDGVVNSYKELIDWAAEHGADAAELASGVSANTTAINNLKTYVGTLPDDATATNVVDYIAEAIAALSIGDYAKASELTALAARVTTLEGKAHEHANKTVLDGITAEKVAGWDNKAEKTEATTTDAGLMSTADKTKLDGMTVASDTEVSAMLTEVFGTAEETA